MNGIVKSCSTKEKLKNLRKQKENEKRDNFEFSDYYNTDFRTYLK